MSTPQPALQHLAALLRSNEPETRIEAAKSLAEIVDPTVTSLLMQALSDSSPQVRWAVIEAMIKQRDTNYIPILILHLERNATLDRVVAERALTTLQNLLSASKIQALMAHPEAAVRRWTVPYITRFPEVAADLLEAAVKDPSFLVQTAAQNALKALRSNSSPETHRLNESTVKLSFDNTTYIENTIEPIAEEETTLQASLRQLKSPDRDRRYKAVRQIGELGAQSAIPALLAMRGDEAQMVRDIVQVTLRELRAKMSAKDLIDTLQSLNPELREWTIVELAGLGDIAIPTLVDAIQDKDKSVRLTAAFELGKLKNQRGLDALVAFLDDLDEEIGERAVKYILAIGKDASEPLAARLKLVRSHGWGRVTKTLMKIGDDRGLNALVEGLDFADVQIRVRAALTLGETSDQRAIEPLRNRALRARGLETDPARWALLKALDSLGAPLGRNTLGVGHLGKSHQNSVVSPPSLETGSSNEIKISFNPNVSGLNTTQGTTVLNNSLLSLSIEKATRPLVFLLDTISEIMIGRGEPGGFQPDVDTSPYGGTQLGVSRRHAVIRKENSQLFIYDLSSTNGTFVNNVQVSTQSSVEIKSGDNIRLGRLVMTVGLPDK